MKRIITLIALCVCLCLCVLLSSCGHEHTWDEGEIVVRATNTKAGTKKFTCSKCEETKEEKYNAVTTITEEQWKNAWKIDNFTMSMNLNGEDVGVIKVSGGNGYMDVEDTMTAYLTKKDGVFYAVTSMAGKYYGTPMKEMELTLAGMTDSSYENAYDKLVYDEDIKAYAYCSLSMFEPDEKTYFYFADGVLERVVSFEGDNVSQMKPNSPSTSNNYIYSDVIITDVGTTAVEVPEFKPTD